MLFGEIFKVSVASLDSGASLGDEIGGTLDDNSDRAISAFVSDGREFLLGIERSDEFLVFFEGCFVFVAHVVSACNEILEESQFSWVTRKFGDTLIVGNVSG